MSEPKCRYCGGRMRFEGDSVYVWYRCEACLSSSPKVMRPDYRNPEFPFKDWNEFWDKCKEMARIATERVALAVPMTLYEVNCHQGPVWIEYRLGGGGMCEYGVASAMIEAHRYAQHYSIENCWYGKDYRFWAVQPTREACTAAVWENADEAPAHVCEGQG